MQLYMFTVQSKVNIDIGTEASTRLKRSIRPYDLTLLPLPSRFASSCCGHLGHH